MLQGTTVNSTMCHTLTFSIVGSHFRSNDFYRCMSIEFKFSSTLSIVISNTDPRKQKYQGL